MSYTSGIERLRSLPAVFRGSDMTVLFQWDSKTASQYLYLWKKRGWVEGFGGHSDVFVNLLMHPHPDWACALIKAVPSAVIMDVEPLRRAGWTTQIPARPMVAVSAGSPAFKTRHFEWMRRPAKWREAMREQNALQVNTLNSPPLLKPAWSLADMLFRALTLRRATDGLQMPVPGCRPARGWHPARGWRPGFDPDEVDWDMLTDEDWAEWHAACRFFRIPTESFSYRDRLKNNLSAKCIR